MVRRSHALILIAVYTLGPNPAWAQLTINDTLTGASSSFNWKSLNGACLTAGDNTGSVPACTGLPYYKGRTLVGGVAGRLPDPAGQGALRLTNGDTGRGGNGNSQSGAVVSNFTFPTNQGVQVTFTTVTYGGNAYRNSAGQASGADGITFFLMDGAEAPNVGAVGGSLGYSCSNVNNPFDGVAGGYLGLGIDEYGNFSNPGDNTATGPGPRPGRISLRGAGKVNWDTLSKAYPNYYPTSFGNKADAIHRTCRTGLLHNFSGGDVLDANHALISHGQATTEAVADYPLLAYSDLPPGVTLYNQEAVDMPTRGAASRMTYALSITEAGVLSLSYSVNDGISQPILTNQSIKESNGPLPASFRFGFSSGTGGGSNVHEITCFKATQIRQSSGSSGTNVQQAERVEDGTQVYLPSYNPGTWAGQLTAQDLLYDAKTDHVLINPIANWDASCTLTGGKCQSTGKTRQGIAPASRTLLSWNGKQGHALQWDDLSQAQRDALTAGDSTVSADRLAYLRGDRSLEITPSGTGQFRTRTSVLGDIMHASPAWVGPPSLPYQGTWKDQLYKTTAMPEGSTAYAQFMADYAERTNVVYAGANDGYLHGFRAGGYGKNKVFSTALSPNDGTELLGYMPQQVLKTIHSTAEASYDYASHRYAHNAYVDATPATGDLYYQGAWHTWLVGGLGGGGNDTGVVADPKGTATGALYALDITDPALFKASLANRIVVGEWTSGTLACEDESDCGKHLGSTYGTPLIRRMHDGKWAVIFGNGYNSQSGTAGIFVMSVDPSNGTKSFRFFNTGSDAAKDPLAAGAKNGLAYVSSADLDGDHVSDYLYAGDLFGNVWRLDVTSNNPAQWQFRSNPVFATGGAPISSRITVSSTPASATQPRVMLHFGTGRETPQTLTSPATYAGGNQALYGIWDGDTSAWNALSNTQYAVGTAGTLRAASLLSQTATDHAKTESQPALRTISQREVCWADTTTCSGTNNQYGWMLTLPVSTEQILFNPSTAYGLLLVNTTIPSASRALTCSTQQPTSGFTMAVDLATGSAPKTSFFVDHSTADGHVTAGVGLNATGSPAIVTAKGRPHLIQQTSDGNGIATKTNPAAAAKGKRINWIRLR